MLPLFCILIVTMQYIGGGFFMYVSYAILLAVSVMTVSSLSSYVLRELHLTRLSALLLLLVASLLLAFGDIVTEYFIINAAGIFILIIALIYHVTVRDLRTRIYELIGTVASAIIIMVYYYIAGMNYRFEMLILPLLIILTSLIFVRRVRSAVVIPPFAALLSEVMMYFLPWFDKSYISIGGEGSSAYILSVVFVLIILVRIITRLMNKDYVRSDAGLESADIDARDDDISDN